MKVNRSLFGSTAVQGVNIHWQGFNPARPQMGRMTIPRDDDDGEGAGAGNKEKEDKEKKTPTVEELSAQIATLSKAHERLKTDSKADRDALKAAQDQLKAIEDEKAEAERKAAEASGDTEKITQQLKQQHERDLAKEKKRADDAEALLDKVLKRDRLSQELDDLRVKPEFKKAAMALLADGIELRKVDGEEFPVPYRGGLPLGEQLKVWAASDEGKPFILSGDAGGEAEGGKKNTSSGLNPWKKETRNLTLQDQIEAQDPAKAKRLKAEAGVA